jgi:hypothetical protein
VVGPYEAFLPDLFDRLASVEMEGTQITFSAGGLVSAAVRLVCALGLSVYEGHANRLHQRLSVQPYVSFGFYYDNYSAHYALNNWGLGPATLRWFWHRWTARHRQAGELCSTLSGWTPT